jgi:glucosylceramidase
MRFRRTSAVALVALTFLAVPSHVRAQTVGVWLTTHNQKKRMRPQRAAAFGAPGAGANLVFVDETVPYQEVEGFGASVTESSAWLLNRVATPRARDSAMRALFTREDGGIGISLVRNPMGASDLAREHYSYDDVPPGETDPTLARFSIARDEADVLPIVRLARELNPGLRVMATPWSAPGWMKTSGSLVGGSLRSAAYGPFAEYFVRYLQAYEAAGVRVDYVSLQNEPLFTPADYPGMAMDAATQAVVLRDFVLPALTANGLATRVLVYDHNWDRPDYPDAVLSDPAIAGSPLVAGVAWHGYGGSPGAMTAVAERHPGTGAYVTEHSGGAWVDDQVASDFRTIVDAMRNGARAYVKWGLALDERRGPHSGGCATCSPLVTVDSRSGAVATTIDFVTLGHFSRFVLPGARRVYSSNADGVISAAFANPDGSKALVVFNDTAKKQAFEVRWGSKAFAAKLPALSGATYVWTGSQDGQIAVDARSRVRASSASASSGVRTERTSDDLGGFDVGYADDGDTLAFDGLEFPAGLTSVDVRVASGGNGGTLEFRLDAADGPLVATATLPVTGGWQAWRTVSAPASVGAGRHRLVVVFRGTTDIGNVNWFRCR